MQTSERSEQEKKVEVQNIMVTKPVGHPVFRLQFWKHEKTVVMKTSLLFLARCLNFAVP